MSVTLEIDGINYEGFNEINFSRSIESISGQFNFKTVSSETLPFPIKRGASCKIKVNNITVLDGYVEIINVDYTGSSHNISVSGRDKTSDVIDSQLDGNLEFVPPISFIQIIRNTLNNIGANSIGVVNEAGQLQDFESFDLVSPSVGQTAFDFLETYARKRQVLLSTDGKGNIVITRASSQKLPINLINEENGINNNILSANIKFDDTQRFNTYKVISQGNISAINVVGDVQNAEVTTRVGSVIDNSIRPSRALNFIAENASSPGQSTQRATWEANIRRVRSFSYSVKVQGSTYDNTNPWVVNRLVQVVDNFGDINAELLIKSFSTNVSVQSGTFTNLELVFKDAYTLQAINTPRQQEINNTGKEFFKIEN